MQNSATKIIKFILNKKNVEKLYKNLSKQTVIPLILLSVLFIFSYYFVKPYFYKYNSNIKVIEKIKEEFKLDIKINEKYQQFLPSPRIKIKKSEISFNNKKNPVLFDEIKILIPVLNNKKLKDINFKKFYVENSTIEIHSNDFKDYFTYLTKIKNKDILFKNSSLFFLDDQKNKVLFKDFYFRDKLRNNTHHVDLKVFSENKIKLNLETISVEKKFRY